MRHHVVFYDTAVPAGLACAELKPVDSLIES